MKALLQPLAFLFTFVGGWLIANHWTHGTPLWYAWPFLLIDLILHAVILSNDLNRVP